MYAILKGAGGCADLQVNKLCTDPTYRDPHRWNKVGCISHSDNSKMWALECLLLDPLVYVRFSKNPEAVQIWVSSSAWNTQRVITYDIGLNNNIGIKFDGSLIPII